MGVVNDTRETLQRFSRHIAELRTLLQASGVSGAKGLWKLPSMVTSDAAFRARWLEIWKEIAAEDGGKLALATAMAIIGASLGGVGIAMIGTAFGLPLVGVLGLAGYLGGQEADSLGITKRVMRAGSAAVGALFHGDAPAPEDRFQTAIETMPEILATLLAAPKLGVAKRLEIPLKPGVYLFSEDGVPIYVGQTRKLRNRYDQHTGIENEHNQASFAFLIAKDAARRAGLVVKGKRKELQADPSFAPHFISAKQRVASMQFQFYVDDDPIRRSLFEIYAALKLETESYNSFETH